VGRAVTGWLNSVRARVRSGVTAPVQIRDVRADVNELRLFKDEHEVRSCAARARSPRGATCAR
jgi:Xaa-Pro aminopeptidase